MAGIRHQGSFVPPKKLFRDIYKKIFFYFYPLEHGTKHPILKLMAYINNSRRFSCSKIVLGSRTNYKKPNKDYLFCFFTLRTMYKNMYLGNS